MITKDDILQMIKHIARRNSGKKDRRIIHPVRDWLVILSAAIVLFLAGEAYVGLLLLQKQQEDISEYTVEVETVQYRQERVDAVLETYRAKKERFDTFRAEQATNTPAVELEDAESDINDDNTGTNEVPDIGFN